jgi:hypothetical protein
MFKSFAKILVPLLLTTLVALMFGVRFMPESFGTLLAALERERAALAATFDRLRPISARPGTNGAPAGQTTPAHR